MSKDLSLALGGLRGIFAGAVLGGILTVGALAQGRYWIAAVAASIGACMVVLGIWALGRYDKS